MATKTRAEKAEISALPFLPAKLSMTSLREAARICRGCPLYQGATQTVFGRGPVSAHAVFVGEQPGHEEDLSGRPFVGPAGRVLDEALAEAQVERDRIYLTNVVKHFKWVGQGKRRLHKKPSAREMAACEPWLHAELELIKPLVLVCLGATAAQALLGRTFRVTVDRGRILSTNLAEQAVATVHPSSILRQPSAADRHREFDRFVEDLKVVARLLNDPR